MALDFKLGVMLVGTLDLASLELLQQCIINRLQVIQALLQDIDGRWATGLNTEMDLGFRRVGNRVPAKLNIRTIPKKERKG